MQGDRGTSAGPPTTVEVLLLVLMPPLVLLPVLVLVQLPVVTVALPPLLLRPCIYLHFRLRWQSQTFSSSLSLSSSSAPPKGPTSCAWPALLACPCL